MAEEKSADAQIARNTPEAPLPTSASHSSFAKTELDETDLLAQISHEVRTPLNSIIGFSDMMRAESFGPLGHDKYRGYVEDIHMSAQHALTLINDLLDISKLHAGVLDFHLEPVSINDIAGQCASAMEPMARNAQVKVRSVLDRSAPVIETDQRALKQILFNLLSNAIKFTEAGGTVVLSSFRKDDGSVSLRVEDNGVGMDDDQVQLAFQPFRQVENVPADRSRAGELETPHSSSIGSGLGLPLARAMSEALGARFELTSEAARGTRIDITFLADASE